MIFVKSGLRRKVYGISEMVDHLPLLRVFYETFAYFSPSAVDPGDCGSIVSRLNEKGAISEKYAARDFSGIRLLLGSDELDNVFWLLGSENPADGRSDMVLPLRLLESGTCRPGVFGPLLGLPTREGGVA